jgi:hypothetical protein
MVILYLCIYICVCVTIYKQSKIFDIYMYVCVCMCVTNPKKSTDITTTTTAQGQQYPSRYIEFARKGICCDHRAACTQDC